jgi:hypothetical protein
MRVDTSFRVSQLLETSIQTPHPFFRKHILEDITRN